jgi:hypothetical protein
MAARHRAARAALALLVVAAVAVSFLGAGTRAPMDFSEGAAPRHLDAPPEGLALLSEFTLLASGAELLPLPSFSNAGSASWHPAAGALVKPSVFYSHSIRHFPATAIRAAGGRRHNVDQLDADFVIHTRRTLWGAVTRFFSVSGEWGFDHQGQTLPGFPRRRAEGRLEGSARARRIFSWFIYGCSNSAARFRGYSSGTHVGNWDASRTECGSIVKVFTWLSLGFSGSTSHMNASGRGGTSSSSGTGPCFVAQISMLPWVSTSTVSRNTLGAQVLVSSLSVGPLTRGRYEYKPRDNPSAGRSGRIVSVRTRLPGITIRYGEAKSALPPLITFPFDRPENVPAPALFRDIHIGSVTLPN